MQRSSVDLPEPDGADEAHHLVLVDVQVDAAQHLVGAEPLLDVAISRKALSRWPASALVALHEVVGEAGHRDRDHEEADRHARRPRTG